ncbi:MAG: tRNA pseudouridine(55) synthase TruB [Desulfurobacteriaceae bacterium]
MIGFLIVDKPKGLTSHDVVAKVRKLLPKGVKVGHTGTLDPLATGILILSVGKATRLSEYLLKQDKCYTVTGRFGLESDTYDIDGKVKKVECREIKKEELLRVLNKFTGEILQVPPPYSAVRIKGKRAYQLAREGREVEIPPRKVEVYSLKLIDFNYPYFTLKVCCSSGTYVRSIVHDIGRELGCSAVVTDLRRTRVGNIGEEMAVTLDKLEEEGVERYLIPPQDVLPFPKLEVSDEEKGRFRNGAPLKKELPEGRYSVVSGDEFIGVGKAEKGKLRAEKVTS